MKNQAKSILQIFIICYSFFIGCQTVEPPAPYGAIPSERQLEWHNLKYYAFIHFGPNTFTDMEWGYGDEDESIFNPTELDARQWARVTSEAGMEGIIITAKHHDGFCLWPTKTTSHSVVNSPWKDGKGDVLKDLQEACDEFGIKMGIYLSPWDRNHPKYGTPEYIEVYRAQLKELLTQYGEIFEFWMDGANGGDGYYGGARETRRIDNKTYYDWENTYKIVRDLQPMAIMFSDGGPDIRWVGNERGYAASTNWSTVKSNYFYPGIGGVNDELQHGHEDGDSWLPTEVNTSIRPGWFYHSSQDDQVKSLEQLVDNWFHSVGMNGNFLLNIPPDQRGLIHENDVARLLEFKTYRDEAFSKNLARGGEISVSNTRGNAAEFQAKNMLDNDLKSFWTTNDEELNASIQIRLPAATEFNTILIQEYIPLGQRIVNFTIETLIDDQWKEISKGTTIGNRRIVKFEPIKSTMLKISLEGKVCPTISNIEVYRTPDLANSAEE